MEEKEVKRDGRDEDGDEDDARDVGITYTRERKQGKGHGNRDARYQIDSRVSREPSSENPGKLVVGNY